MDPTQQRIAELLHECHEGADVSAARKAELNDLLRESEENREFAARLLLDGESLIELLATQEISEISAGRSVRRNTIAVSGRNSFRWWTGLAAAAALVILIAIGFRDSSIDEEPIAVVHDTAGTTGAISLATLGESLDPGSYELQSGLVTMAFRNGVKMTVRAPSRFEIIDAFHVVLHTGSVRAFAPESGHGFTIETSSARLVDLGTEFGVTVDEASGESRVQVFDGRVDVKEKHDDIELASLGLGEAARIRQGQVESIQTPQPGTYPSPNELGLARWKELDAKLRRDEELVFYYNFAPVEEDPLTLLDVAEKGPRVHGKISGARWVTGRWPGKSALLFDDLGDAVELEIDQELPQLTFSAWIKVDRHDDPLAPIFNSHGWSEGDLHIQYSRSRGVLFAGVHYGIRMGKRLEPLPVGTWVHVAVLVDMEARESKTWIDGKPAVVCKLKPHAKKCLPGFSRLGYWEGEPGSRPPQGFRGRMDEMAMWSRALSEEEIRRLALIGRP